jgi:hypothetical protein
LPLRPPLEAALGRAGVLGPISSPDPPRPAGATPSAGVQYAIEAAGGAAGRDMARQRRRGDTSLAAPRGTAASDCARAAPQPQRPRGVSTAAPPAPIRQGRLSRFTHPAPARASRAARLAGRRRRQARHRGVQQLVELRHLRPQRRQLGQHLVLRGRAGVVASGAGG